MEPTWYTLPDYLIEQFPDLREEIESEYFEYLTVYANPYPHVFLGSFLAPMILDRHSSPARRRRAGEILDLILTSADTDLAEAALLEILENLADAPELLAEAWPWLGPNARELVTGLRDTAR